MFESQNWSLDAKGIRCHRNHEDSRLLPLSDHGGWMGSKWLLLSGWSSPRRIQNKRSARDEMVSKFKSSS